MRSIRRCTLIACVVALLALPAAAGAMPQIDPGVALHQENAYPPAPAPNTTVVRTVKVAGSDTTLPTVLAALALGITFAGAAYITLRLKPQPRGS
ncbi:MAG TPA: hypothetical protein VF032_09180 [Thermoleophilaceae bacterium]